MSSGAPEITPALYDYILKVGVREAPLLAELREETAGMEWSIMQIAPDQGQFMGLLAQLMEARRYLEIGTFTGYSSLALALAVPELAITCLDISEEWTAVARRYWQRAGVEGRVDLRLAPALESLAVLQREGAAGSYDLCFIDAAWEERVDYYEAVLPLMRRGGLIMIDNVFGGGEVLGDRDSEGLGEVRRLNEILRADERVDLALAPFADGLTLARKR